MAPARACMLSILSWARCIDIPASPIDSEMPETASPILVWASAAVYVAFMVSFLVRKESTWDCNFWAVAMSFVSWSATC